MWVARSSEPADPGFLFDPSTYAGAVPHAEFARRRRDAPVAWVEEKPIVRHDDGRAATVRGDGYWAVTRHATIIEVSRRRDLFSSAARGAFLPDPKSQRELAQTRRLLLNMDAPEHGRLRQAVAHAFKPAAIHLLEDAVARQARALTEPLLDGRPFDVVADLATELPLRTIASFVGMPLGDRGLLLRWSTALVGIDDPDLSGGIMEYRSTLSDIQAYARELLRDRRRTPGDDLASMLAHAVYAERTLTEDEFCDLVLLIVIAGNETTRHLLSGMLAALAEWPHQRDRLIADPALVPTAVEELLRYVSPVMQLRRTAAADTVLDGQPVRAGDKVVLYYVSGNRDERVFEKPMRLDLGRRPNPHLAFGHGPHFCLGAALARLEARALLLALGRSLRRLRLTAPPRRLRSNFVNGHKTMPARLAIDGGHGA